MFTASWVVSYLFFSLELFPKTRKKRNSKEKSQPGKKRRHPDDKAETAEKSSKETKHRKSQQDKKVNKSVKLKVAKKGVKNRGKHVKLKRKSRKWYRTSCLASKSSQILEALQIKESKKILKNKDFATIDVQIYSLRGFEIYPLCGHHSRIQARREWRCDGSSPSPPPPYPPRPQRSTFLLTSDFKQSELRVFSILIHWLCSKIENTVSFPQNIFQVYSLRVKV